MLCTFLKEIVIGRRPGDRDAPYSGGAGGQKEDRHRRRSPPTPVQGQDLTIGVFLTKICMSKISIFVNFDLDLHFKVICYKN